MDWVLTEARNLKTPFCIASFGRWDGIADEFRRGVQAVAVQTPGQLTLGTDPVGVAKREVVFTSTFKQPAGGLGLPQVLRSVLVRQATAEEE